MSAIRHFSVKLMSTLLSLWLYALLVNSQLCSEYDFGRVSAQDCLTAINDMPFRQLPTSFEAQAFRLFSEPQFQRPKFGYTQNPFASQPIVQLPKLWKQSKSKWNYIKTRQVTTA